MQLSFYSFYGIPWKSIFTFFKVVFIILDIAIFVLLIYSFRKALQYRPDLRVGEKKKKKPSLNTAVLQKNWATIIQKSSIAPPQSYVVAIIEADKFVDDILKQMGFGGEHMADRLAHLNEDDIKSLPKLWRVHRIRNELVHTPGFVINPTDAKEILGIYETFLKELNIM